MKSLKEVKQITGIQTDNLRHRIKRGTLKATKIGRDWFVKESDIKKIRKYNARNKV